ncbi:hypothetical protein NW768_001224 [Fusarium equiseti]|uniref:Uncharacterized protein n=1 Tax=Fusarium equiseti TaxID=61235 RepID=A0ABQ8RPL4_FUSEQ|nr:hypothetical protein NW768_001224 [Fusarium equiseti]
MSTPSFLENDSLEDWESWDESLSLVLPDTDPVMDQLSLDPPDPEELTIPELKAEIDHKVSLAAEEATREYYPGYFHAYTPRTEVDWTMEGRFAFRAVHLGTPTSVDDLFLVELNDPETSNHQKTFLWMSEDDNVFFGRASTNEEMTLDDYIKALEPVPDKDLFPELPADTELTIAFNNDEGSYFCKRPDLFQFEPGFDFETPKQVLGETLIMETLAQNPHPNIIQYKGCRVKRGRITGIVVDKYEKSLEQFIKTAEVNDLDLGSFLCGRPSTLPWTGAQRHQLRQHHNVREEQACVD